MRTEIVEADPFSGTKSKQCPAIETDYHFEARDEIVVTLPGDKRVKVRVTLVHIEVSPEGLRRELSVAPL